jgi:hypothetical protein
LKYENEDKIKSHGFFRHHYYQLWFIISIQLSKLLTTSKNQKYNFNKLFDRLEKEEHNDDILNLLAQNKNQDIDFISANGTRISCLQQLRGRWPSL